MTATIHCAGCQHAYIETALFCPNCGRPKVREAAADPLLGKVLGERFLVQELLGQGGSGSIYRAEHVTLRRRVAIKVLHNELSRDDLAVERFRREATTVAEVDNEHIVEIHDFGRTPDGRLYLAMELLEGETLDAVLEREHQLSVERAADVLIQVGEALMEAHAIGYVHRDLRPRNIYLAVRRGKANFIKLLDFGLAKLVETEGQAASTSLGMTFGDPRYMSPEQARGDSIDRRADIYQLGCVAYEMLTGAPPFGGNRVFDILTKQVTEIPQPLPTRRPGVPLWMEAAVAKMLAKDPENRFATTTRMVEALRRGLETGEVMDDEIARRRESIPPPSVSRVMQRMGVAPPSEPAPAPVATPVVAVPPVPTDPGTTMRAPIAPPPAKPDSVELLRKRTGTPRIGVPILDPVVMPAQAPVVLPAQPPVAGVIEPVPRATAQPPSVEPAVASLESEPAPVRPPMVAAAEARPRGKRPSASGLNSSQVWFEQGDELSGDDGPARSARKKPQVSPSTTDLTFYDDERPRRRWGLFAGIGAFAVLGGVMAVALTRGASDEPAGKPQPVAAAPVDVAPSAVSPPDPPSTVVSDTPAAASEPAVVAKPPSVVAKAPGMIAKAPSGVARSPGVERRPAEPREVVERRPASTSASTSPTGFPVPLSEPSRRPPSAADVAPVVTPAAPAGGSAVPSLTDKPQDPYAPEEPPASLAVAPDKKAEFFANLGAQQLGRGDTAGAAASFQKAAELDRKNVGAVAGLGEIALRQGLFGDAIAHLSRAAKLSPRNGRVLVLLGEAYLSSGNHAQAATQFKKALQVDPDNARARDGYNEASSRVPPAED